MLLDLRLVIAGLLGTVLFIGVSFSIFATLRSAQMTALNTPPQSQPVQPAFRQSPTASNKPLPIPSSPDAPSQGMLSQSSTPQGTIPQEATVQRPTSIDALLSMVPVPPAPSTDEGRELTALIADSIGAPSQEPAGGSRTDDPAGTDKPPSFANAPPQMKPEAPATRTEAPAARAETPTKSAPASEPAGDVTGSIGTPSIASPEAHGGTSIKIPRPTPKPKKRTVKRAHPPSKVVRQQPQQQQDPFGFPNWFQGNTAVPSSRD